LTTLEVNIVEKYNVDRITIVVKPQEGNPISVEITGKDLIDGRNYMTEIEKHLPPLSHIQSFSITIDLFPARSVFRTISIF